MQNDPNEKKDGTTAHNVTAEDLQNNPDLAAAGVQEGEEIGIPNEAIEGSGALVD